MAAANRLGGRTTHAGRIGPIGHIGYVGYIELSGYTTAHGYNATGRVVSQRWRIFVLLIRWRGCRLTSFFEDAFTFKSLG